MPEIKVRNIANQNIKYPILFKLEIKYTVPQLFGQNNKIMLVNWNMVLYLPKIEAGPPVDFSDRQLVISNSLESISHTDHNGTKSS